MVARSMDFGGALFCMKAGGKVRRSVWVSGWTHMALNAESEFFYIESDDGHQSRIGISSHMCLAEDWQEVE